MKVVVRKEKTLLTDTAIQNTSSSNEFGYEQPALDSDQHFQRPAKARFAWGFVAAVIAARAVSYFFLKADSGFTLVPRSFVGGAFHSTPALLDVTVPLVVIAALFSRRRFAHNRACFWRHALADAAMFLLFPLLAGLTMFAYQGQWYIVPNVALGSCLRWLQWVAAYLAWNLLLDELPRGWQRLAAVPMLAASLGFLQDLYPGINWMQILLSVGLTLTWTVLALRRRYRESPLSAALAAAIIGGVACMLAVARQSDSALTFFLSLIASPLGAMAVRSRRASWKWTPLVALATVGLVFSAVVPRFLTPDGKVNFLSVDPPPARTEQVEGITVKYDDVRVRDISRQLAHVMAAANQISREAYGISPEANTLVVRGFADGGFHAEFPHAIAGNLVSTKQLELSLDSAFLNGDPKTSVDFPDPVNGILHEYSHLYGVVPYQPWLKGTENEGWATFSATRLAQRLYERFGPGLWSPAYDYASRADAITRTNLAAHPLYWSHPQEDAGFRLWYALSQKHGEANLYRARWQLSRRDYSWAVQVSDPGAARKVSAQLGFDAVASAYVSNPRRYGEIYPIEEVAVAAGMLGRSAEESKSLYARRADRLVDATIRVPAPKPARLDILFSVCSLALLLLVARLRRKKIPAVSK